MSITLEDALKELNVLKDENNRLKEILKKNNIKYELQFVSNFSEQDKINIFMSYFRAREDALTEKFITKDGKKGYAKGCANRFSPICDFIKYRGCKGCPNYKAKEYNQSIVKQHINGYKSYGIYPMVESNMCYFLAVDFDDLDFKSAAVSYYKECLLNGIDALIELSQSGKGAHVWIFFNEKVFARKARLIGDYLLTCAISNNDKINFKSYDRLFPSQDTIEKDGFGNCIGLPLFGKCVKNATSVFVDENFVPYQNQFDKLKSIKKLSLVEVDLLINKIDTSKNMVELDSKKIKKLNLRMSDFPKTVKIALYDDIYISKTNISTKGLSALKRLGVVSNPEYYEKQRMRISTFNIPRVIQLFIENERLIMLPRGCKSSLEEIFNFFNIKYEFVDKRALLTPINTKFNGQLRQNQIEAVDCMLKQDNGILVAETGSGKTIMAINLISKINKPTLILVDKIKLLEQWKERLDTFLTINDKDGNELKAGVLYSGKDKLNQIVDIVSIKSLTTLNELCNKYELMIVDEVHHIAARSFEAIIRKINTRYTYGLTATPTRSDHLEQIIYKCIGPVIKEVSPEKKDFEKILFPKFTNYKYQSDTQLLSYVDLCSDLCKNQERNNQIVNDIVQLYNKKKNVLVLTERIEHIETLCNLLSKTCQNIFSIHSNVKTKEKKEFSQKLESINDGFIIVSTGKFLGEGFDFPRLNTLFLTMPFKWKGSLIQYIGRIQRSYENKEVVEVYDYVDIKMPQFSKQFEARLRQYKKEEYVVKKNDINTQLIFSFNEYYTQLIKEIQQANEVVLLINKASSSKVEKLFELNSKITIYSDDEKMKQFNANGIHSDINAIILDSKTIWYGSINPFGYSSVNDTIMRIEDKLYASMLLEKQNI